MAARRALPCGVGRVGREGQISGVSAKVGFGRSKPSTHAYRYTRAVSSFLIACHVYHSLFRFYKRRFQAVASLRVTCHSRVY